MGRVYLYLCQRTWLLNVNRLAAALSRLTCDAAIHAAAPGLGGRIAAEDGVGRAVAWIETVLHDAAAVSGGGHSGTVNGGA